MARENYFILLELSFDPPANDEAAIKAAITKKQQQWSKDQNNPAKRAKAIAYLAMLKDIEAVMLDPAKRKAEAEAAKKIKGEKLKDLKQKLFVFSAKGPELSDRDLKILLKNFQAYGFDAPAIKKLFKELTNESGNEGPDISDVISKDQALNITNNMKQLGMLESTLYDFLNLSPNASCEQLRDTAESMKKKILAKGDKTGEDVARQALCGLCSVLFKDPASKRKYDNYYNITKYARLNSMIDELARSNGRKIEPKMKEKLIELALQEYQVKLSEASMYIANYCAYSGYAMPENKIVCGNCHTENPAGSTTCSKCGKQLIIICPACGAQNDNATKTCIKCKFDLSKMDQALAAIEKAKKAIVAKKYDEAADHLKEAKLYWSNHPDIASLEKSIRDFRDRFDAILKEINADIAARKFYTARTHIQKAQNEGYSIEKGIFEKVAASIQSAEERIAQIRQMGKEEAFSAMLTLADSISDSAELKNMVADYPPDPATGVKADRRGGDVVVNWEESASGGKIDYLLIRKEKAYPNGPDDGQVVYEGKECSYTDTGLNKSTVYYYIVLARRIGVLSKVSRVEQPQVIVDPVSEVRAIGGDGMLTLSWKKAATVSEIKIWQYQGDSQPASQDAYTQVPCNRLDGAVISGLENGRRYWLRIVAYHTIEGSAYPSDDVIVNAVPQRPAKPLENFTVHYVDDRFLATWKQSEWDVILFYAQKKPDYAVGVIYDVQELTKEYQKIDISLRTMTEAEFTVSFVGECYIIPGVINASNVILNEASYVSSVPPAKEISFDLNSAGTELYVNFTWPKQVNRSLLVYRMDEYPSGPDDPLGKRVDCNRKQYDMNGGILISNPAKGVFYAVIYTYFEGEGRRIYADGVQTLINNEPQRDVFYTIRYKKQRFSKKRTLEVTVKSTGKFLFPQFVIVSKFKSLPLRRDDGDIVCSTAEETEITGTHTFTYDVSDLREGTRVKMFFLNDQHYKKYKIQNEGSSSI